MTLRRVGAWTVVALAVATVLVFHEERWFSSELDLALAFYVAMSGMLIWMLSASARRRRFTHLPVAPGRVVAIVPAYNEDTELLYACIESLLAQTVHVYEVVVVDDGSEVPALPYQHPRVTWMRQPNQGKRHAQVNGLRGREWADFIVTVDSDSVVALDGVEHLLRTMSDDRIQAATGMVVMRNRTDNILTRLVDLEIGLGNLVVRRARSAVGAVAPTSGALALYRAEIFFTHADEYVKDGTFSDDRRLTHFSLMRGQVVAVDEAVVDTELPSTYRATFKQRVRWYKGTWAYLGWELRNLTGWAFILRCWSLLMFVVYPLIVAWAVVWHPLNGGRIYWEVAAYWAVLLYAQTFHYVLDRPGLGLGTRIASWVFLTPLLLPYQTLLIRPAMYWAITQTRKLAWSTRGDEPQPKRHRKVESSRGRYRRTSGRYRVAA